MRTPHNHTDASRPKAGCNLIGMQGAGRMESQSHYIRFDIPIYFPCLLIHMDHLPVRRNPASQIRHRDLLKVENS